RTAAPGLADAAARSRALTRRRRRRARSSSALLRLAEAEEGAGDVEGAMAGDAAEELQRAREFPGVGVPDRLFLEDRAIAEDPPHVAEREEPGLAVVAADAARSHAA